MNGVIFLHMGFRCRLALRVFLALFALLTLGRDASAFCFAPQLRVSDEYFISDLVLTGTVMASRNIVDPTDPDGTTGIFYTVRVDAVYRGNVVKSLEVYSENSTARFPMEEHKRYILFLKKEPDKNWGVDNCGSSGQVSLSASTMKQLKQLPLRNSYVYGDVYSYAPSMKCGPMRLTIQSAGITRTTTVKDNCSFQVEVPPGSYRASLVWKASEVPANDLNYKDVYCFIVPKGGSAGLAFRTLDGADASNREMILKDDLHARSQCTKSRSPEYLF
jgi:hypothetical protein